MKNKSGIIFLIPLVLIGVIIAGAGFFWFSQQNNSEVLTPPTPQSETDKWKTHNIEEINLTFRAPEEMEVSFESQKDDQTGVAYSHTLYVQKGSGGTPGYYQLYGLYQVGQAYIGSLEFFKDELDNAKEITVSGLPAISGQVNGQRNRFVTHILMPDGRFSLFTAEPTEENRLLTEKILETFEITEKDSLSKVAYKGFSITLPKGWTLNENSLGLMSDCRAIQIVKFENQNTSLTSYVPAGYGSTDTVEKLSNNYPDRYKYSVSGLETISIGATGEAELEHIIVKDESTFYEISVYYNGSLNGSTSRCENEREILDKQVQNLINSFEIK